ncbi:MAG: transposase [Planctomycetota bacterium]|jgi:transposase
MLAMHPGVRVFVARGPTDMRKGFDGLTGLVCELVKEDPQSGHLFVFWWIDEMRRPVSGIGVS